MNKDFPDIYLLAEAERDNLADATRTFDANYAWELHHLLNAMAQGRSTVADLKDYVARDAARFPAEAFRLTFTSNHDENSWNGTEFEREGEAADVCAVLCFTLPQSQPLVYTGQEIGLSRRLAFFEKDPITDWSSNEFTDFYKRLIALKHQNPALAAGERGGKIEWFDAPEGVVAFQRSICGNSVVVVGNFGIASDSLDPASEPEAPGVAGVAPEAKAPAPSFRNLDAPAATVTLPLKGSYTDWFTGEKYSGKTTVTLAPGAFIVLTK